MGGCVAFGWIPLPHSSYCVGSETTTTTRTMVPVPGVESSRSFQARVAICKRVVRLLTLQLPFKYYNTHTPSVCGRRRTRPPRWRTDNSWRLELLGRDHCVQSRAVPTRAEPSHSARSSSLPARKTSSRWRQPDAHTLRFKLCWEASDWYFRICEASLTVLLPLLLQGHSNFSNFTHPNNHFASFPDRTSRTSRTSDNYILHLSLPRARRGCRSTEGGSPAGE